MSGVITSYVNVDTAANRPATPPSVDRLLYLESDTLAVKGWDGSAWHTASGGGGGSSLSVSSKTAAYTITTSDDVILADGTSGAFTVALPTAVGWTKRITIKKVDSSANAITVGTTSGQTIDGASNRVLSTQFSAVTLVSDNANWRVSETDPPAYAGPSLLLDYVASTDLASGTALTAATWTDVGTNQSFTVTTASKLVRIAVRGIVRIQETAGGAGARIVIDSAGTPTNIVIGGNSGTDFNVLAGADAVEIATLSAAAHTVKLQVVSENTGTLYCRPSTRPMYEALAIQVVEYV